MVIPTFSVALPRPGLDVGELIPDFHGELRWPLSQMTHPAFEPSFPVARVFAQGGVTWHDLCERGAHRRHVAAMDRDAQEYLAAWCKAASNDVVGATQMLVPLLRSPVAGLPAAVRIDLAMFMATSSDLDAADHLFNASRADDLELLDTLVAMYVELDKPIEARVINRRALEHPSPSSTAVTCRRLARGVVLGDSALAESLTVLATKGTAQDPTCIELYDALSCWRDRGRECAYYLSAQGMAPSLANVLEAYREWPTGPADFETWLRVAREALLAADLPEGAALLAPAIKATVRAAPTCNSDVMDAVRHANDFLRDVGLAREIELCPQPVTAKRAP